MSKHDGKTPDTFQVHLKKWRDLGIHEVAITLGLQRGEGLYVTTKYPDGTKQDWLVDEDRIVPVVLPREPSDILAG